MARLLLTTVVFQITFILFTALPSWAKTVEYNLTIAQEKVNITGKSVQAMTINGTIPGPALRFREGDRARIHVKNTMNVETSIHWHGLLVPPGMDGVPFVSFPPIAPGATFTYAFTLRQSGTYWYHSHTSLQEQSGVYGGIAIEPRGGKPHRGKDHVVVLSDWTDDDPHAVLRTLRRGSEWFAIEKGSGQSIIGAARIGMLGDYFSRELQRMPPMDIADVAYDHFLANGKSELTIPAAPGETVRLRIIDGSATTFFHLTYAGGPLTIVSADGQDVRPVKIERLLIGVAETYDVLVTVPRSGAFELRATAHDASAFASIWIGSGKRRAAPAMPKPNLYQTMGGLTMKRLFALTPAGTMGMSDGAVEAGTLDKPGMMPMHGMDHGKDSKSMDHSGHTMDHGSMKGMDHKSQTMDHGSMKGMEHPMTTAGQEAVDRNGRRFGTRFGLLASDVSSSRDIAADGVDPRRPGPPYDKLRALRSTALPRGKSVREIRLTLDGDMERYIWLLNNKALSETDSILIKKGEIVRFIMINRTMMHHPMHLHGHFFRVINGQGNHAPLKHTVDVEPMSTTVIEFYANEFGDWFFHCHLLYHMKAGMAGLVHYDGYNLYPELAKVRPQLYKESWYVWGETTALSNMAEASITLSDTRNIISLMGEVGWEEVDRNEWEALLTWDRYVNRFFTYFIGVDVFGERSETEDTRGVLGFTYLLPLNIETRIWADDDGGWRGGLHKVSDLTPRLALFGEYEYDSHEKSEARAGLAYTVSKSFSLVGQWHSEFDWGGGLQIRF
ncbi:MAG TPA: copper oxidase [Nitrospiraceae bacterium]|nr:copper oxidase [Nitrospiraceae bacterium]